MSRNVRVRRAKWGWRERTRAENIRRGMRWPNKKAVA